MNSRTLAQWSLFDVYPNELEAYIVAGLLENEGVRTLVAPNGPLVIAWSTVAILVPTEQLHTAKWILAQPAPTDAELEFLATGRLPATDDAD